MEDGEKVLLTKFTKATEDHMVRKPGSTGPQMFKPQITDAKC